MLDIEIQIQARRIARELVKTIMREKGIRISSIPAPEITAAADKLIQADPSITEIAKADVNRWECLLESARRYLP